MNVLPYEVKRAHWRGTWHAIRRFRARADEIGEPQLRHMTPARFDILFVAWRADWQVHEKRRELGLPPIERRIAMWELRDLLGLAGPTISRAAHRLDELELVRVVRDEKDARYAIVVLTELGERMLRLAVECIRQDRLGMRDCIVKYLSDGALEQLSSVEPAERIELDDRLGALVDRSRRYAQFFGCQAVPIYDTRVVMHLRPRTVSLLTWNIHGPDPRSEIMRMNQVLISAAGPGEATRGLLDSLPTVAPRPAPQPAAREQQQDAPGQEPRRQEPPAQEPLGQEPPGQEPLGQQPPGQEPLGQEPPGQEPLGQEPPRQEPLEAGAAEAGAAGQEPPRQEPLGQEPPGQEPLGQEPIGQEHGAVQLWRLEDLPADYFWSPKSAPTNADG